MEILREIRRSGFSFQRLSGIYSELNQMKGVPQNPVYHSEGDVFRHTEMVCDCLLALPEWSELEQEEQELLFLAAAFHDIGKVFCTKQEDGNWVIAQSYNYWRKEVPMAGIQKYGAVWTDFFPAGESRQADSLSRTASVVLDKRQNGI